MTDHFESRASPSALVKLVWEARFASDGELTVTADGTWDVVFGTIDGDTSCVITGPTTRTETYPYRAGQHALGIQFREGSYLAGMPAREVVDARRSVTRAQQTFLIMGYRFEVPTYASAEDFVGRLQALGILQWDPLVPTALADQLPNVPPRTVQRHFSETTGIPLRQHQQILRAQKAAALLRGGGQISDVVHECGYFDQAHMTRQLKQILGLTPQQIRQEASP